MEKIENAVFESLFFKRKGRKSKIFEMLMSMKTGECVRFNSLVLRSRNHLSRVLYYLKKNYGYRFSGDWLADGSGWAYRREK